jgi:hypothetical protein
LVLLPGLFAAPAHAAILPEDRVDVMYHGYEGGGLTVDGPAVLVRKAYKDKVSVWGNYLVDMISSASIDVVATASEYTEERTEYGFGADYLHGKTMMSTFYVNSTENDYEANTAGLSISQDFFGDLTNLGISYARGWDTITRTGDETFEEELERQNFGVTLSQVLTRNMLLNVNYESVTEEGFLQSAYRQVRYLDPNAARGYSYDPAVHPRTKTTSAIAARAMYFLPYRASVKAEARRYTDTWGVEAWNAELGYVHPFDFGLTAELRLRYYEQTEADFYSDLYSRQAEQNFMSRDKELSTFNTTTVGAGLSYEFATPWLPLMKRGEANLFVDWLRFDYDSFRDVTVTDVAPGEEPLYSFDAVVIRAFFSFWL